MGTLTKLYRTSLALLTDLYELTMAYGYWKSGNDDKEAVFNLYFRENPFQGGFSIACGLSYVVDFLGYFHFSDDDTSYLASLRGNDGEILFESDFLDYLSTLILSCDIDAIPEGTVVFPFEPLVRVKGPLIQCQILETALLNMINFQTLIATKAARVCLAARGEPVLEFGLRRAQGFDGSLMASRAAYIGGCAATSNVLAGKMFGIPVKGTHAHSWVMSFDTELEAFLAYAEAMPNNCVFLVDTYNTLEGVRKAVEVGTLLRNRGHEMLGIRLDSGDLAHLSVEARKILDEAGFEKAVIIGSNELDEHAIASLKEKGSPIGVWGVGTKLATGYDQPALGGVYKLVAVRRQGEDWHYKVKLSEEALKTTIPGILQVRRFYTESGYVCDVIFNEEQGILPMAVMVDPMDMTRLNKIPEDIQSTDLLVPVFRHGELVFSVPEIHEVQRRVIEQLTKFQSQVKHFVHPSHYPVGLEQNLHELMIQLIHQNRT